MDPNFEPTAIDPGARPAAATARVRRNWVPPSIRRLEARVMLAAAALLAALALLAPAHPATWASVLLVLGTGLWANRRPAHSQRHLLLRGALVTTGWLLVAPTEGSSILLAGLAVTMACHAFLLRWPGAAALLGATLAADAALRWGGGSLGPWQFGVDALLLGLAALAGALAGQPLERADVRRESERLDPQTGLYNRPGLFELGGQLVAACGARRQPVSLAVFECRDLLEVRGLYGSAVACALLERLVERLSRLAGEDGMAARTGPAQFAVLLPGAGRDRAVRELQRVLGLPARIEYEQDGHEVVLVPEFVVDLAGPQTPALGEWYAALSRRIARARDWDERRRRYLRRSRQGNSRSLDLESTAPAALPALPATMPAPLGA
jgi:GGDEF domain-containing protein